MKKTILLSAVLAAGAAFASEMTSGNAVGALDKQISTADAGQILISVPFLGYDGEAVKVAEMVKTSNLDVDSKLYVPDGTGKYNTWTLNASGQWEADKQVTIGTNGQPSEGQSDSQANATVSRGDAFWLEPKFKSETTTDTIFLLGQGTTATGISNSKGAAWNLIGNASTEPKTITEEVISGAKRDEIIVQVGKFLRTYYLVNGKGWCYQKKKVGGGTEMSDPTHEPLVIQPGQGFWHKPASDTTVSW